MGGKRRSDKHHDVGDSMPGTVGDKRPDRDRGSSPMERIHNRRQGDLMSREAVRRYLRKSRSSDEDGESEMSESEQARAEGFEDKWQKRFSHLPGVPNPNENDR